MHELDITRSVVAICSEQANAREANPELTIFRVSAQTGEGMEDWYAWIESQIGARMDSAIPAQANVPAHV